MHGYRAMNALSTPWREELDESDISAVLDLFETLWIQLQYFAIGIRCPTVCRLLG
jgi:hypothetical protein